MPEKHFQSGDLRVRIGWLEGRERCHVHIEHKSGAALIVPSCPREIAGDSIRLETTGFDGTTYSVTIDGEESTVVIESSAASPILGGGTRAVVPRSLDGESGAVRVTGDEETMPIQLKSERLPS